MKHNPPVRKSKPSVPSVRPVTNKRRKPGLWFSKMKVEIQVAKKSHRTDCWVCGVRPVTHRLAVMCGSGRHGWTEVYCVGCGKQWLDNKRDEAEIAAHYLTTGEGSIRQDMTFTVVRNGKIVSVPAPTRKDKLNVEADGE